MASTTPLLLLLDSVLSQEADRIRDARTTIRQMVSSSRVNNNPAGIASSGTSSARPVIQREQGSCHYLVQVVQDVDMLLTTFPKLACTASTHDGSLPLHFAASIGNVQLASRILSQYPAAASTPNTKGKIPLHYAAREGRNDMVAYFLNTMPQTAEITSKKKKLALHFAAGDGHTDVVRQLLRAFPGGASMPSKKGKLPLHFASRWGHLQIASDLLLLYPEGVRCVDWDGSLPLHDAAREGQVAMSKFLIERYPIGLSIANIRGETPLFPAVRSGNVDLVILYLQGWAKGGGHILRSVSADDHIEGWDWKIVELCLRGAVENFSDCDLIKGKVPPAVRCSVDREDLAVARKLDCSEASASKNRKHTTDTRVVGASCYQPSGMECYSTPTAAAVDDGKAPTSLSTKLHQSTASACPYPYPSSPEEPSSTPRSKSPILLEDDGGCRINNKKRLSSLEGNDRKRIRSGKGGDSLATTAKCQRQKFIALHAALACGASSHVIRCVMNKFPTQLLELDDMGQFPLHHAVRHPTCCARQPNLPAEDKVVAVRTTDENTMLEIVLEDILKPHPQAAFATDTYGRLPLHLAIAARADFTIIQALVQANPSSSVDPVRTDDIRFDQKPPIYMATEFDCDLSTTYLLLREYPSVVAATEPQAPTKVLPSSP